MPANKDFAQRLEIIDECLRNRYRNWTLIDLITTINEKLDDRYGKSIKKRTVQNDLKYLIIEKDAPIKRKKNGKETYFYYSDPTYSIKNLPINPEEVEYLSDAIKILRQVSDFTILDEVEEVVTKLQNTLKLNEEKGASIIQFEKHTTAEGNQYIDPIFSAIKLKLALRITYQSFNSKVPKTFIFHPYLLKEYRNRWFVAGRKENSDNVILCALDRIKSIQNSTEDYVANNLFDPETYFSYMIGVTKPEGAIPQFIELKVNPSQAPYIRTKPIHHTQELLKTYANGALKIRIYVVINHELRSVLLGFTPDVEVLKPSELRLSILSSLEMALDRYSK